MNNLVIDHTITKTEEGTYYTIPFAVPEGIEKITVSYSYQRMSGKVGHPEKMVNVVDLGLMNESGKFLGWSGSSRSSVFVGPYSATNGYLMSEVKAGEWKILVGAYKIPPAGLPVRYEITFTPSQPRWLLGDLHMHSTASDGQYDVSTLARMAQKKGLDFIALTNHNNYSENLHLPLIRYEQQPGLGLAVRKYVLWRRGALPSPSLRAPAPTLTRSPKQASCAAHMVVPYRSTNA